MRRLGTVSLWLALFALSPTVVSRARAQALPAADRGAEISLFGDFMARGVTDYGRLTNKGFLGGADFTPFIPLPIHIDPSLEVRGSYMSAAAVTEKTATGGLRLAANFRERFHLYGDIEAGLGEINFHPDPYPGYSGDRGFILSFGGGLDIDLFHHISLNGDYQGQKWNLGQNQSIVQNGNFTISPNTVGIGIRYHIPFHARNRQPGLY